MLNNKENKEAKGQKAEFQLRAKPEGRTTVIHVARTAKVVKGGKRFGFRALVAVGDGNGKVGVAIGKANQVQFAVSKAEFQARKEMVQFPLLNGTIPHEIMGCFGSAKVWMKPAAPGTGVIAGAAVRLILEAAGVKNILSKSIGSTNSCNLAYATMECLKALKSKKDVLQARGKYVEPVAEATAEAKPAEAAPKAEEAPKAEVKGE